MQNMNPHENSPPGPNEDPLLAEMLSPLQRLEPPLEARVANGQAVAAALSSRHAVNRTLPWWRRSISIPVPIAAALVLLLAVALYANFRSQPAKEAIAENSNTATLPTSSADTRQAVKYYETETYLCGVGRVSSESYYVVKD